MAVFICNRVRGAEAGAKALEPFEVVRTPLAERSSRIFPDRDGGPGVTYESHEISLARGKARAGLREGAGYALVMRNGSGVSVLGLPTFYDGGAMVAALLAMPDPILYATLYTLWRVADEADDEAKHETARRYSQAFVDKRLKKKRRNGSVYVEILPWFSASASYHGQPPTPVPGRYDTAEAAFEAARAAHPNAHSFSAAPIPA